MRLDSSHEANDQAAEERAESQPESRPDAEIPDTVGTGSALAIGCIVAVVLLVLLVFAVRWIGIGA